MKISGDNFDPSNPEAHIERDLGKIDPRILALREIAATDLDAKPSNPQAELERVVMLARGGAGAITDPKPTLFIYHKGCFDGFTSAWIYSRFVDRDAEFLPARYGDKPPYANRRRVVVADFSYPREQMANLLAWASEAVVLDHHKTAEEALVGLEDEVCAGLDHISAAEWRLYHGIVFDMERSGAGITWDYFAQRPGTCEECGAVNCHHSGCVFSKRPALVDYVEDRDL